MAALARAALLSSRLNFATEVWPLLIDKDGFGGIWLGADYIPFERCIWTAGTRQPPNAGEEAGTSFSAASKAAPPLEPPKRSTRPIRVEEEEEPHEVLARKMANQKQTKLAFGKPQVTEEEEAALPLVRCERPNHAQCRRGCTCLLPLGSAPPPLSSAPMRLGNGKAVLDVNGDASFSHTQYATDAQGRTVSVHGPGQEEAPTTTTGGGGGGEVWVLLL